jgi:hypothetical protein
MDARIYGTGHELSFLAFLGGIWKLNGFPKTDPGVEERAIVVGAPDTVGTSRLKVVCLNE